MIETSVCGSENSLYTHFIYFIFVVEIGLVFNSYWEHRNGRARKGISRGKRGDEFLEKGIICPVPGCLNKGHIFKKYNIYVTHYNRLLKNFFFIFTCPICKVKETEL